MSFTLVSNVQDILDPHIYQNGPWVHLATVTRARPNGVPREYVAFKRLYSMDTWIEYIDTTNAPHFSRQIEDDQEWEDVRAFMEEARLLSIGLDVEVRLGRALAQYMEENYQGQDWEKDV